MEENIGQGRVVRSIHILPRTVVQFIPDVELHVEIYVGIDVRYKKLQIILIYGAIVVYAVSIVPRKDA